MLSLPACFCCLHGAHQHATAAGREEDAKGMRATPEAVAHWLLRDAVERDESPAAFVTTVEAVHTRLRVELSAFLGQSGFDAIWARAVLQVARSVAGGAEDDALMLRVPGWPDALSGRTMDEIRSVVAAAFTSFIGLLFTFVGAELGFRLLYQVWPELPLDPPGTATGDVTA